MTTSSYELATRAADRVFDAGPARRSLAPDRLRARPPSALLGSLLAPSDASAFRLALAHGLEQLLRAIDRAFPGNLFCDLDFVAAATVRAARAEADSAAALASHWRALTELQGLFGDDTVIHFRYVHDFLYGYDWSRWVARDPAVRASVGPFDPAFLRYMHERGRELVETIAHGDDPKYPPIASHRHRNPFGFSREPQAEAALHRHLAAAHLLPVESWRTDASPRWDRDFTELRRRAALELGLGPGSPSSAARP